MSLSDVRSHQVVRQVNFVGVYVLGALALPAWHVLPVFLDLKIAADPALPGLTHETLPIATTVTLDIFQQPFALRLNPPFFFSSFFLGFKEP